MDLFINVLAVLFLLGAFAADLPNPASISTNTFALKYLATTLSLNGTNNLALGLYNIWELLVSLEEGARGNTATEMENVIHIPNSNNRNKQAFRLDKSNLVKVLTKNPDGITVELANAIYANSHARTNIKPEYWDLVQRYYNTEIALVNLGDAKAAAELINKKIANATHGRVVNAIDAEFLENAELVATSTFYFKGVWKYPFASNTTLKKFYNEEKTQFGYVPMMNRRGNYHIIDVLDATALEIPYVGDKISMIILLPENGVALKNVLQKLSQVHFGDIVKDFEKPDRLIHLSVPKFKIEFKQSVKTVVQHLGIRQAFEIESADFGNISPDLYIQDIVQLANIDVDTNGTEAGAAVIANIAYKSSAQHISINKPFAYFIYDKSVQAILFAGTFVKPE